MTEPVIIKEDLTDDHMSRVQSLMSDIMNKKLQEKGSTLPKTGGSQQLGQAEPQQALDDYPCILNEEKNKKYKICVIEKGQIKIQDELENTISIDSISGGVGELAHQKTRRPSAQNSPLKLTTTELGVPHPAKETVTVEDCEPEVDRQNASQGNSSAEDPKVEKVDADVMNKLLDYYRKFNERQLGIEVDSETPSYKQTSEAPTEVVCDNNIIKEAVQRVGKAQEEGVDMKEPTVVPSYTEEEKTYNEKYTSIIELDMKLKEKSVEYNNQPEFDWMYPVDYPYEEPVSTDDDWTNGGANFIEKALQKRIDEDRREKATTKKWDQKDIVKLVEMLSKKRGKSVKRQPRAWNRHADCRDDLLDRLQELESEDNPQESQTVFHKLKSQPGGNDWQALKNLVEENGCQPVDEDDTDVVYTGGQELVVAMEYVKSVFSFSWLWHAYERMIGNWFNSSGGNLGANGGIASGYDEDDRWHRWTIQLKRLKSLSSWFPSLWGLGSTGKPIYKQVEYEKTNVVGGKNRYATEVEETGKLTNRKLRNISEETILQLESDVMRGYCRDSASRGNDEKFCCDKHEISDATPYGENKVNGDCVINFDV